MYKHSFIGSVLGVFGFLISLAVLFLINVGAIGAFGWPTEKPIWLLLTIPVALLCDAIWFITCIRIIDSRYQP